LDVAASSTIGIVLMVSITIILAALLLHLINFLPHMYDDRVPAIFQITKVRHTSETGKLNYDSYVVVMNTDTRGYKNQNLFAKTYRNGVELSCRIPTMNGHDFIDGAHHYDVQRLAGVGAEGKTWYPAASLYIDYEDYTFQPGDIMMLEVYDNTTKRILSRHTYTA
jgi:hypothetical protein